MDTSSRLMYNTLMVIADISDNYYLRNTKVTERI